MDIDLVYNVFGRMSNCSLSYVYRGNFNPDLTQNILDFAENSIGIKGESSKTQKKVYFIMVESLQNITRHGDSAAEDKEAGFFVMQNTGEEYFITSGNTVNNEQALFLKDKLEDLNRLSPEELKQRYLEIMNTPGLSDKGGAGLGLIEMMRKSGNKLAYDFKELDDLSSYFYFQSRITPDASADQAQGQRMLETVKELHDFSNAHEVSLIYHGLFAHGNLKNLLTMTEGGTAADPLSFRKKSVNVMIEMLQNINYHAANPGTYTEGKPAILVVSMKGKDCYVSAGNYILKEEKDKLVETLDRVNQQDLHGLEMLYKEKILKEDESASRGAKLGFIDLRMKTGNVLTYSIREMDTTYSFFSVQVKING